MLRRAGAGLFNSRREGLHALQRQPAGLRRSRRARDDQRPVRAEKSDFWKSPLAIAGYDRIRQIGWRSNGPGYIPRRYCIARANVSDPRPRPLVHGPHAVIYAIGEGEEIRGFGFFGMGYGVEWCVIGLDRDLAFAPGCQAVRPIIDTDIVGAKGMDRIMQDLSRTVKMSQ